MSAAARPILLLHACALIACSSDATDHPSRPDAAVDAPFDAVLVDVQQDTSGTGGTTGSDAAGCPAKSSVCPASCVAIQGWPIDAALGCLAEMQTLGCGSNTGTGGAIIGCVQDPAEATRYQTPSTADSEYLIGSGAWIDCPASWSAISLMCP